jgi:hypothetical protein
MKTDMPKLRNQRAHLVLLTLAGSLAISAGEELKIPGVMLRELTKVTPEMMAKITAACPTASLANLGKINGYEEI